MGGETKENKNHPPPPGTPKPPAPPSRPFPPPPPPTNCCKISTSKKIRNIGILLQIFAKFDQAPEGISPDLDTSLVSMFLFLAIFLHGVSVFLVQFRLKYIFLLLISIIFQCFDLTNLFWGGDHWILVFSATVLFSLGWNFTLFLTKKIQCEAYKGLFWKKNAKVTIFWQKKVPSSHI